MNSTSIRSAFPAEYQEFFSRCSIVCSATFSFHWVGEYAMMYGNPAILQKIPLRMYIGLEPASKWAIEDFRAFGPFHQRFETYEFPDAIRQKLTKFLSAESENIYGSTSQAYKIWSLSELPPGVGCNLSGAYSAALATALMMDAGKIETKDIQNWMQTATLELRADETFDQVRRLAWKLETIWYGDRGSGAGAMLALLNCDSPFLYFTEPRSGTYAKHPLTKLPHNVEGHYEVIDEIKYWGFGLQELFELPSAPTWPIDFGLIFTGTIKMTDAKIRALQEIKEHLGSVGDFVSTEFKKYFAKEKDLPRFYEFLSVADKEEIWHEVMGIFSLISVQTLQAFKTMFVSREDEGMRELMECMNHFQHLTHILKVSPKFVDKIITLIQDKVSKFAEEGIALKTTGAGAGGNLVFACAYGQLQEELPVIVKEVAEATGREVTLHYASWLDGIAHGGVSVDQHLGKQIYSEYISQESIFLTIFERGTKKSKLESFEIFSGQTEEFDILFDIPNGEISVRGKGLTSKEIRSASATIEIFSRLLAEPGKSIPNTEFPRSAYSTNRNDFQSKIVLPLSHAVEKSAKKKLEISLNGALDHFFVKLDPANLKIAIVEKVF